jgi:hypothetical protein
MVMVLFFCRKEVDIRPTVAITKAHIQMLELVEAMEKGRLVADGKLLHSDGSCVVTKAAIEHVWHLPGTAIISAFISEHSTNTFFEQASQSASAFPRPRSEGACSSRPAACFQSL